jgi:hypothetical protein
VEKWVYPGWPPTAAIGKLKSGSNAAVATAKHLPFTYIRHLIMDTDRR